MKPCSTKVWMDAEPELGACARAQRGRGALLALAAFGLMLGCFTQKPSSESAPSAPAAAPEPAPPPPVPPPAPAESLIEPKKEAPASAPGDVVPRPTTAAPSRSAPAAKPAKARSSAVPEGAAESERAIGGNADDAERDAPALRQRLDRAYRAGSPDCPSARERKKAVCDLATQICQLTDRDPNVASVAEYCSEAKQRCSQAEQRTLERCPD